MQLSVLSPCKLNLFLYITGKRPDGYHNLQTLFVVLNYGDTMTFTQNSDNTCNIHGSFGFKTEDNLIYKAWKKLHDSFGIGGVDIRIKKTLPMGGGLGGGSANAATMLLVLNHINHLNLSEEDLIRIGAALGADVPIFIKGGTCYAEGIGEKLTRVKYKDYFYLVVTPSCKVPTKELFASQDLKKDYPQRSFEELMHTPFENCFTKVVEKAYPQVSALLSELSQYGQSYMSGSGSSCFVAFESEEKARIAMQRLQPKYSNIFIAPSVNYNPILKGLSQYLP
jgi:4-diphosphocytidyl-2-C-methyl-D-erythritol kinase